MFSLCVDRIVPDRRTPESPTGQRKRLAADQARIWPAHQRVLHVRFLDGHSQVWSKVTQFANEWSKHAHVRFVFDNSPNAPIRVSFQSGASWSLIGTDATNPAVGRDQPTMNLGWLTMATPNDEAAAVVLHEFGHALGMIHEHQNPSAAIPWNKPAVYDFYGGPPNYWSPEDVDRNVFQTYDTTLTNFSAFDPASIMLYPIPSQFTDGTFSVGWNKALSASDKSYIGIIYP